MKNKKKSTQKSTKILCPSCGTEFVIPDNQFTTAATVIGKDSGLGTIYPVVATKQKETKLPKTVQERLQALSNAGIDVSKMFAVQGANGKEYIVSDKGGKRNLAILEADDPIFSHIAIQGTVPNRRLFRRYVMAQMFYMMSFTPHGKKVPLGVTKMIHNFGYEYQWKMLLNELYAQMKMEGKDTENFADRNRWFNVSLVVAMAEDYMEKLKKRIKDLPQKRCKNIPYKRIGSRDIFISDLQSKLYTPLTKAIRQIAQMKNATQLYFAVTQFNEMRIKMAWDTPQSKEWVDAYKGSGAYFTMQNMIRFHNCIAIDDVGKYLDKDQSLYFILAKAEMYKNGEGWRLLATLKKMLENNNINIKKKVAEWRKKK